MNHPPYFSTDAIRVESPGENFEVERLLIDKGGGPKNLTEDRGRIRHQVPWYRGWQAILAEIEERNPHINYMNHPAEIAAMFDKTLAQRRLFQANLPIPEFICEVKSFAQLIDELTQREIYRIFIKPAHSSSASGIVALQLGGNNRILATAPATYQAPFVYNTLRIQQYRNRQQIERVINALVPERIFAERWFPKASINGRVFDLRVLIIAGKAAHVVVRTSQSPITNLHLGNQRGDVEQVMARIGDEHWAKAMSICEHAAKTFPKCHYVAVDLMVGSGFNRFAIAEVNAFGDLIPNVFFDGDDTYASEIRSFMSG